MISAARESDHDMTLEVYHSIIWLSVEATRALLSEQFIGSNRPLRQSRAKDIRDAPARYQQERQAKGFKHSYFHQGADLMKVLDNAHTQLLHFGGSLPEGQVP